MAYSRNPAPDKSKVTVWEWEDGMIEIHYRGRKLSWRAGGRASRQTGAHQRRRPVTPTAAPLPNHPSRRSYQDYEGLVIGGRGRGVVSVVSASAWADATENPIWLRTYERGDFQSNAMGYGTFLRPRTCRTFLIDSDSVISYTSPSTSTLFVAKEVWAVRRGAR